MDTQTQQAILTGGQTATATLNDGTEETVTVRLLRIKEFPEYLRLVDDEEKLAEFLCNKPEGWAESLTIESLLDICEKGHEVNFKNACRWGERRAKLNEALLPIAASGQAIQSALPKSPQTPDSPSAAAQAKSPQP